MKVANLLQSSYKIVVASFCTGVYQLYWLRFLLQEQKPRESNIKLFAAELPTKSNLNFYKPNPVHLWPLIPFFIFGSIVPSMAMQATGIFSGIINLQEPIQLVIGACIVLRLCGELFCHFVSFSHSKNQFGALQVI